MWIKVERGLVVSNMNYKNHVKKKRELEIQNLFIGAPQSNGGFQSWDWCDEMYGIG